MTLIEDTCCACKDALTVPVELGATSPDLLPSDDPQVLADFSVARCERCKRYACLACLQNHRCPSCAVVREAAAIVSDLEAQKHAREAYEAQREAGYCNNCACGFHVAECTCCGECDYTLRAHEHDKFCGILTCAGSDALREGRWP